MIKLLLRGYADPCTKNNKLDVLAKSRRHSAALALIDVARRC